MTDTPIHSTLAHDPEFRDLVCAFVEELSARTGRIVNSIGRGDLDAAADLLHQLKGAAGIYGFNPIYQAAAEVEKLARDGSSEITEKVNALASLCKRATSTPE